MAAHLAKVHLGGKGNFPCSSCETKLDSGSDLSEHMKSHSPVKLPIIEKTKKKSGVVKTLASKEPHTDSFTPDKVKKKSSLSTDEQRKSEYVLPEMIKTKTVETNESLLGVGAKTLDTFTSETESSNTFLGLESLKLHDRLVKEQSQSSATVSAACKAMEVLYSVENNS